MPGRPYAARMTDAQIPWSTGSWTTPPRWAREDGDALLVAPVGGSDAWVETAYGFTHDDAHGLLTPLADPGAVEVTFSIDGPLAQFDQAGLMLRVDSRTWLKAGVEMSDGVLQVGAVVTLGRSDWSVRPVPTWAGRRVTIRASHDGEAVTLRARVDDEPFELLRVAPFVAGEVGAGPFCAAPTQEGVEVRFHSWRTGPADAALH